MLVGEGSWVGALQGLRRTRGPAVAAAAIRLTSRSGHRVVVGAHERLLVARDHALLAAPADGVRVGDFAALRFGGPWPAADPRSPPIQLSPAYGSQKRVSIPSRMDPELAFLLGAYASEGHTTTSNWTVTFTNAVDEVLERVQAAVRQSFGTDARIVRPAARCPSVVVASKTVVEFLQTLGCGRVAVEKRIPSWVMECGRDTVVAFLEGLFLDAFTAWMGRTPKWGIAVISDGLLDDVQLLLTRLGVVHGRSCKTDTATGREYGEIYAVGEAAQRLLRLVPFAEPYKARRADERLSATPAQSTADVVPLIRPRHLHDGLPRSGSGRGPRTRYAFLRDPRTSYVSRRTLERLDAEPGVMLPPVLQRVLAEGIHFSPVTGVVGLGSAGLRDDALRLRDVVNGFVPGVADGTLLHADQPPLSPVSAAPAVYP